MGIWLALNEPITSIQQSSIQRQAKTFNLGHSPHSTLKFEIFL